MIHIKKVNEYYDKDRSHYGYGEGNTIDNTKLVLQKIKTLNESETKEIFEWFVKYINEFGDNPELIKKLNSTLNYKFPQK